MGEDSQQRNPGDRLTAGSRELGWLREKGMAMSQDVSCRTLAGAGHQPAAPGALATTRCSAPWRSRTHPHSTPRLSCDAT